jgi:ATP-binding cassette subfamily F protein 2
VVFCHQLPLDLKRENMPSKWAEKQAKKAEFALNKALDEGYGKVDEDMNAKLDSRDAAMGKGDEELFEKKLSKEEKKALAAAKREAKKKAKEGKDGKSSAKNDDEKVAKEEEKKEKAIDVLADAKNALDINATEEAKREAALEKLSEEHIIVTYENKKGMHPNARDINVGGVTVTFHGKPLIEDTEIIINYGNRYGFIGPNGSGKSTIMKAIAARAIPIPESLDIYFLDHEYPASDITALEAVMESNDEVARLEKRAEMLNNAMADADDEQQAEIQATCKKHFYFLIRPALEF